jgi:cyclopropane-fatty-acyl-phospholipid synthase
MRKYIFPGAYVPSLSEVFASTERLGLCVADMEVLRQHYHYTLSSWRARFAANRDQIVALSDERFARAWEYYLAAVDVGFLNGSNMVFQILISIENDAAPIVRDRLITNEGGRRGQAIHDELTAGRLPEP